MYIDKLIKKEVITLLVSVSLLVIIFIGVTYAKFLSVDKGQDTVINMGDLNISFCKDTTCDTTYTNIGQVIGTKIENGTTVPAGIYPFKNDGSYSNETPYIFKVTNTGSLDSTVKIKLKEDTSFTPTGDYSSYTRLTSKYADHLKVAISKRELYEDTGYQLGDVNMDGFVNFADFLLLKEYFTTGVSNIKPEWDISMDGNFNGSDITMLKSIILGLKKDTSTIFNINNYTSLEDGVIYDNDIIKAGEEAIYFVWLYLDETTPNDAQKTFFVGNIDVDGEYSPDAPEPINFSTDSWKTIVKAVQENNIGKYNVGDTKEIDMGTYGTHTLRIANTSTPSECSTNGFSQTACGFVLEFADIITTHTMNDTATNVGGWPASAMYTFVNTDIYNALPSDLRSIIIDTTTVSSYGSYDSSNFTSTDKLYLLSTAEVWAQGSSNTIDDDTARDNTRQLDYYKNLGVTTENYSYTIKRNGTSTLGWWLRSSCSSITNVFFYVGDNGNCYVDAVNIMSGVSPAFRIG